LGLSHDRARLIDVLIELGGIDLGEHLALLDLVTDVDDICVRIRSRAVECGLFERQKCSPTERAHDRSTDRR